MPKKLKIIVFSEEKKGSVLGLLEEGYSERQTTSKLTISKMAVQRSSYRQAEGENDSPLTGMTTNSFVCHSTTVG